MNFRLGTDLYPERLCEHPNVHKLAPYLISTDCTIRPSTFVAHPLGDTDGCYTSRLGDDDITVLVYLSVVIQDELWHLCSFT